MPGCPPATSRMLGAGKVRYGRLLMPSPACLTVVRMPPGLPKHRLSRRPHRTCWMAPLARRPSRPPPGSSTGDKAAARNTLGSSLDIPRCRRFLPGQTRSGPCGPRRHLLEAHGDKAAARNTLHSTLNTPMRRFLPGQTRSRPCCPHRHLPEAHGAARNTLIASLTPQSVGSFPTRHVPDPAAFASTSRKLTVAHGTL
jgi:hypothetical protein